MIQAEGVESLSEAELRESCRERGLLGLLSVEEMRQQVTNISIELMLWCISCCSSLFIFFFIPFLKRERV